MCKQAKIVFVLAFFLASLLVSVEFFDAKIFAVEPLGNDGFSIEFELDESVQATLSPGDLIEVKETGRLGKASSACLLTHQVSYAERSVGAYYHRGHPSATIPSIK